MGVSPITQNHKTILVKAVSIAKANGFEISDSFFTDVEVEDALFDGMKRYLNIIFDHQFARCFWTEETCMDLFIDPHPEDEVPDQVDLVETLRTGNHPIAAMVLAQKSLRLPLWQYNLAQMSLSEDPLLYIGSTLKEMGVA